MQKSSTRFRQRWLTACCDYIQTVQNSKGCGHVAQSMVLQQPVLLPKSQQGMHDTKLASCILAASTGPSGTQAVCAGC